MAKTKDESGAPEMGTEPIDIDTFMTTDDVEPAWINGLMVYLASKGGSVPRSLEEWRKVLRTYQALR